MTYFLNIKRYRLLGVLFTLAFLSISCEDLLDERPISEIGAADFWQTSNDAALGVVAVYDGMQGAFRTNHYYWGELRSDSYGPGSESASANNLEMIFNDITSGNGVLDWSAFYTMINRANLAIQYIPDIVGADPNLLGEVHAIRAKAYFDALRVWGDLPLFTEPVESSAQELQRARTSAATILSDVVIPDMLRAEELMTLISDEYRFTRTSIWALQAEVYMWTKDYAKAKEAIEKIIASNEFSLTTTPDAWQDMFINDIQEGGPGKVMEGPELMLSIRFDINEARDNPGQTRANRAGIFALFFAGLPSFHISPLLENKWQEKFPIDSAGWVTKYPDTDPVITFDTDADGIDEIFYGDWRYYFSREGGFEAFDVRGLGGARLAKYNKTNYSQDLDDSDIVLYRYAGMLYLLAEAENQLGNGDRALEIVNEIRVARQLPLVKVEEFGASVDAREMYILDESQLELLGEGKRWWDLRRTGQVIPVMNAVLDTLPGGVPLTQDRLLFPIFDEHLIENPSLIQNAGY